MKIVHIITALGFGGGERLLVNTTNMLCQNHEVTVIYLKNIINLKEFLHPSISTYFVPLGRNTHAVVRAILKEINPNIIHTHLGHADLIGLWAARGLKAKLFCTMHNIWFKWNKKDYLIFAFYSFLFNTVAKNCKVICISQSVKDHVIKRLKVKENNAILLYNVIPAFSINKNKKVELRAKYNIPKEKFCLLFVGRLELQKSVDTLLYAIREVIGIIPNLQVNIVGEGSLKNQLEELSVSLGINEIVKFRGVTFNPEEYFVLSDLFILPSIFEGFGLVILEAFRAGLPVIATDIEGPKELIEHGNNGLLFKPKEYSILAKQIEELFLDEQRRASLGQAGEKTFVEKFTIEEYVKTLDFLYQNA